MHRATRPPLVLACAMLAAATPGAQPQPQAPPPPPRPLLPPPRPGCCAVCLCGADGSVDCSGLGLRAIPCVIPANATRFSVSGNRIRTLDGKYGRDPRQTSVRMRFLVKEG